MKHKIAFTAFAAWMIFAGVHGADAADYVVDYKNSKVEFSGTHADNPFSGQFGEWTAEINFDPTTLEESKITAIFKPASAKTGNAMYDGTLPAADWFDVANHPDAKFVSQSIALKEGNHYTANGDLTIRGITKPVVLDFTLSDLSKLPVKAEGTLTLNRLDFDLGKKSDSSAEWVSKEIAIKLSITAAPAP